MARRGGRGWGVGHQKGWNWGEAYRIRDRHYASGNSASFNEGVRTYAASITKRRRVPLDPVVTEWSGIFG